MDKPEEKSGPLKPPHPPPGKKPGTPLPKGPVPPRGGMQLPGVKPVAKPAVPPASPAIPPLPPQAKPPAGPPSMPPRPPTPPGMSAPPSVPPAPPPSGAAGPFTPALSNKISEANAATSELEQRIADLEKKLLEEREKVLLASLRTKEEEAVSAKVETSIKDIQEKLRREKREQELDESRRKSEARANELERRMAEEREAWVSTLKGQLGQRDQITQEMETHFSSRLKDLEYRWSQEKSGLESALREREAELTRVRHEYQIKGEQEKAFWEDRLKSVAAERDKLERELERTKDKFAQEKDHLLIERQSLRDQVSKADSLLKFVEEQTRTEKAAMQREAEAHANLIRQQGSIERESFEKQIANLNSQIQTQVRDLSEKTTSLAAVNQQLTNVRGQINQLEFRLSEREKVIEEYRRKSTEIDGLSDAQRKKYEVEIEQLQNDLSRAKRAVKEEAERVMTESESRIKTLQSRLDWYDTNIKREYDNARMEVSSELTQLEVKYKEAQNQIRELQKQTESSANVQQELDQVKAEWKQAQWDLEAQLKEANDQLKLTQGKLEQAEDARISLEQELRQRSANADFSQSQMEQRELEIKKLLDRSDSLEKELALKKEKEATMGAQFEEYKRLLHGKGLPDVEELQNQIRDKSTALDRAKETIHKLNNEIQDAEKREQILREKERSVKDTVSEKDEILAEFKNRVATLDRKLKQAQDEFAAMHAQSAEEKERILNQAAQEKERLINQKQIEIEQARRAAAEEMAEKIRAELPPPGPAPETVAAQIRQDLEAEYMDRLRDKESEVDSKVAQAREETKKEMDRLKWEAESMKEELKRAREARSQIEREAQELLQQAEAHYQRELAKHSQEIDTTVKEQPKGFFTRIGRILDTPIIDTGKKKKNEDDDFTAAA